MSKSENTFITNLFSMTHFNIESSNTFTNSWSLLWLFHNCFDDVKMWSFLTPECQPYNHPFQAFWSQRNETWGLAKLKSYVHSQRTPALSSASWVSPPWRGFWAPLQRSNLWGTCLLCHCRKLNKTSGAGGGPQSSLLQLQRKYSFRMDPHVSEGRIFIISDCHKMAPCDCSLMHHLWPHTVPCISIFPL